MERYADGYIKEIESIKKELKLLTERRKILTARKQKLEKGLYDLMKRNQMELYQGYKKEKLQPKPVNTGPRKKKKEKYNDAIRLFMEIGIPDPESFYEQYQKTQKSK